MNNVNVQFIEQEVTSPVAAPKRKRKLSEMDNAMSQQQLGKKRQAKTLFRPWNEEQKPTATKDTQNITKTTASPKSSPNTAEKPNLGLNIASAVPSTSANSAPPMPNQPRVSYAAPALLPHLTPYQLAMQQQHQQQAAAMAMQQAALYQRQLVMAHIWAQQQHQQHQHNLYQQHQMQMRQQHFSQHQQQQMFAFAPQPGNK